MQFIENSPKLVAWFFKSADIWMTSAPNSNPRTTQDFILTTADLIVDLFCLRRKKFAVAMLNTTHTDFLNIEFLPGFRTFRVPQSNFLDEIIFCYDFRAIFKT